MAVSNQKPGSVLGAILAGTRVPPPDFPPHERMGFLTGLMRQVVQQFYPLVWQLYMTPVLLQEAASAKFNSGNGTFAPLTREIEITMTASMTSQDIGKQVVFNDATEAWTGFVELVNSATKFIVRGHNLPSVSKTVIHATVLSGPAFDSAISLNGFSIMWAPGRLDLEVESSLTDNVEPLGFKDFKTWDASAYGNEKRLVWTWNGNRLYLKTGASLVGPRTLQIRYPRLPEMVLSMSQDLDIPEGAMTEILKLAGMQRLQPRIAMASQRTDYRNEMQAAIARMYESAGMSDRAKSAREDVRALT